MRESIRLAVTVADAEEIVRVSEKTGGHVMVNYTHRRATPDARWGLKIVRISNAIPVSIQRQAAVRLEETTI